MAGTGAPIGPGVGLKGIVVAVIAAGTLITAVYLSDPKAFMKAEQQISKPIKPSKTSIVCSSKMGCVPGVPTNG